MTRNINDIIHDFFTHQRSADWFLGQLWSNNYRPSIPKGWEKKAELTALKMAADEATLAYQTAIEKAQGPKSNHTPFLPPSEDKSTIEGPAMSAAYIAMAKTAAEAVACKTVGAACSCHYEPEASMELFDERQVRIRQSPSSLQRASKRCRVHRCHRAHDTECG